MTTCLALVMMAASAGWAPAEWTALRGPGYEVQFPGNPSLKDAPFVFKAVPLKLKYYGDEPQPGRLSWGFGTAELPARLHTLTTPELLASDRAYAATTGVKLVKQAEISGGTETIFELKSGVEVLRRLYVNSGRLYQLTVIHPKALDVSETFQRFAASLKLSAPAPAPDGLLTITEASFTAGLPGYADRTVSDLNVGGEPVVMRRYQVAPDAAGRNWSLASMDLPPGMLPQAKSDPRGLLADFRLGLSRQGKITQERPAQLKSWKGAHHGLQVQLDLSDGQRSLTGFYLLGQALLILETRAPKSAAPEETRAMFDRIADTITPRAGQPPR
jgi:hypothetical protein